MNRRLSLAALCTVAALAVTGCSSAESSKSADAERSQETTSQTTTAPETTTSEAETTAAETTPAETTAAETTPAETTAAESTTAPAETTGTGSDPVLPAGATMVDLKGKSFTATNGLGEKITFLKAVRGLKPKASAMASRELIYVQVECDLTAAHPQTTCGDSSFTLTTPANKFAGTGATLMLSSDMKTQGFEPLPSTVASGTKATGWVAGYLNPAGDKTAQITYHNVAMRSSDGKKVPEQNFSVTLA